METVVRFNEYLKKARKVNGLKSKEVAVSSGIDQAIISKYENGIRLPTDQHQVLLSKSLNLDYKELRKFFLAEKIVELLKGEDVGLDSLLVAEPRIQYLTSKRNLDKVVLDKKTKSALDALDGLVEEWKKVRPQEKEQIVKVNDYFSLRYTYESNRIEGNKLTLSETILVLKEGKTVAGKSIQEHLEAINHDAAIQLVYKLVEDRIVYDKNLLIQLHKLILGGAKNKPSGSYRDVTANVIATGNLAPEPEQIVQLMEAYFSFHHLHKKEMHPVILAAEMHERLLAIHPFVEGNGRIARLLMNSILLQHAYPIAILEGDSINKQRYYDALTEAHLNNERKLLYNLIIERLSASIQEHIALAL